MDRRSWLWRRKSSEKSPGETESSGSVSSLSERFSDDQDASRASPVTASPNNTQSPDPSSKIVSHDVHETVKSLNEKLSDALVSISAKEDLVKQHAKVAEEAVAGWETAENEVTALKQQLEATIKKNSALQERIGHLDGALKECVRQLRQSREEQEQKFQETLIKKTNEWESQKIQLEVRITELQVELDARKTETTISNHDLQLKLQDLEKENSALKAEIYAAFEDLQMKTLESELSTQAAETASKQHLESIKKVAKLEAECRRLRAAAKRSAPFKDNKPLHNSICVESLTDSQSDCGERLFGVDNELSCSDSWASALITELDQFKNDKIPTRKRASSVEIDVMDDFLEMERLASLPEANTVDCGSEFDADNALTVAKESSSRAELEALQCKMAVLEEKYNKIAIEKLDAEMTLAETRNQLKFSRERLMSTEDKLVELQQQLNSANGSKHAFEMEVEALQSRKKALESQLKAMNLEVKKLRERVGFLEGKSAEFATKCQNMDILTLKREQLEAQLMSAQKEVAKLREKADFLENKVEEERTLSAKLAVKCQNMEAIESESMGLESKLISAQLEGEELLGKVALLEGKLEEQRALSEGFAAKVQALEEQREALRSQLEDSRMEAGMLREKTRTLDKKVEADRALSAECISKVEALEAKKEKLSSQLQLAHLETEKLGERVGILEKEVEAERTLSSNLASRCKYLEALEVSREEAESQLSSARIQVSELCQKVSVLEGKVEEQKSLQSQLELAHLEVRKLHEKVSSLEKEINDERKLSAEVSARCQSLKDELLRMKQNVELHQPVTSLEDVKIKQEEEFALAAGKLVECQNTIASLSRQLKSLADFDQMLEFEEPELDDKENFGIPNRSYIHIQN